MFLNWHANLKTPHMLTAIDNIITPTYNWFVATTLFFSLKHSLMTISAEVLRTLIEGSYRILECYFKIYLYLIKGASQYIDILLWGRIYKNKYHNFYIIFKTKIILVSCPCSCLLCLTYSISQLILFDSPHSYNSHQELFIE